MEMSKPACYRLLLVQLVAFALLAYSLIAGVWSAIERILSWKVVEGF